MASHLTAWPLCLDASLVKLVRHAWLLAGLTGGLVGTAAPDHQPACCSSVRPGHVLGQQGACGSRAGGTEQGCVEANMIISRQGAHLKPSIGMVVAAAGAAADCTGHWNHSQNVVLQLLR